MGVVGATTMISAQSICAFVLVFCATVASSKPTCCWSKWSCPGGGTGCCEKYPSGISGAHCNSDWSKTCVSDGDCPLPPTAAPTPPKPTPPPTPPAPPPPLKPPYRGFWYGWVGSHSPDPAPLSGWFFSFPGLHVSPPFDTTNPYGTIPSPPVNSSYDRKILTQGGGDTTWGDAFYQVLEKEVPHYKPAGWDGVCWDWEKTSSDHTSAGFNSLMNATKRAGLINIVTSTAEGPYIWSAPNKDATDIDWSLVDFFVPQLYGAAGTLPDGWEQYANYWVDGAGKPTIHNVTFAPIPMKKIMWGMPAGTCQQGDRYGGSGCIEWAYSPGVH